jgi:hypothetical protein
MSALGESEIMGTVLLPPREEQLQPRVWDTGGRNVPVTSFRLRTEGGAVVHVTYSGEMDGQVSQGDVLVVRGHVRGPGQVRATEVWLRGRVDACGEVAPVEPPVRIAQKSVCVVATALYGAGSPEVTLLLYFRDTQLARFVFGRVFIRMYYYIAPFIVFRVLEPRPGLTAPLRRVMSAILRPWLGRQMEA